MDGPSSTFRPLPASFHATSPFNTEKPPQLSETEVFQTLLPSDSDTFEEALHIYCTGMNYMYGNEPDFNEAAKCFTKAMDMGFSAAYNSMGLLYDQGLGVDMDKVEAFKLFEQSAKLGCVDAYVNIGVSYFDGDGVPQNRTLALQSFLKGAKEGSQECCNHISRMFKADDGFLEYSSYRASIWKQKGLSMNPDTDLSGFMPEAITAIKGVGNISIKELAEITSLSGFYRDIDR